MDPLAGLGLTVDTLYDLVTYVSLATARPLGATLLFTAFIWGRINTGIIRSVVATSIALPVLAPAFHSPVAALAAIEGSFLPFLLKELGIGLFIGLAASLPLQAIGLAGNVVDAIRGGGQLPAAEGDNTVFGQLFMVIALWIFADLGGFFRYADMIYQSYGLWPLTKALPPLQPAVIAALVALIGQLLLLVATLSGALVVLLLMVDLTLLIASRLGRRMNVLDLSQSIKNTLLVIVMPIYAMVIVRVATGEIPGIFDLRLLSLALTPQSPN